MINIESSLQNPYTHSQDKNFFQFLSWGQGAQDKGYISPLHHYAHSLNEEKRRPTFTVHPGLLIWQERKIGAMMREKGHS